MNRAIIALTAIALTVMGLSGGGVAASRPKQPHFLPWGIMTGPMSTPVSNAVTAAFQKEYPGWTVNVEIQQWNGIATKLITALASTTPPDAMEIGNTDVAEFAASGGLENLSSVKSSLPNSSNYLKGLEGPAECNEVGSAVPLLASDPRPSIYNKEI